jgi:dCTP deaminase
MILTGSAIEENVRAGRITISDFCRSRVNPNSYNYRLGPVIKRFDKERGIFTAIPLPENGLVLEPREMYLGSTLEIIGSDHYSMSLIGRSSIGRLGLFLQVSADLGHTTSCHCWTLELVACRPIRLYSSMNIGQVSFWRNHGQIKCLGKTYAGYHEPTESRVR